MRSAALLLSITCLASAFAVVPAAGEEPVGLRAFLTRGQPPPSSDGAEIMAQMERYREQMREILAGDPDALWRELDELLGAEAVELRRETAHFIYMAVLEIQAAMGETADPAPERVRHWQRLFAGFAVVGRHLDDPDPAVHQNLLRALGYWAPAPPGALAGPVAARVDDPDDRTARIAMSLLGSLRPVTDEAVAKLLGTLGTASTTRRRAEAAEALGKLHESTIADASLQFAEDPLPESLPAEAREESEQFRRARRVARENWALADVGTSVLERHREAILQALLAALAVSDTDLQKAAASAFGRMGAAAEPALPALEALAAATRDETLRMYAKSAVSNIRRTMGQSPPAKP